jgi:hypothetical protein
MLGGGLRRNPSRRLRPDRAGGRAASRCRVRGSAAGARPGGGRQHRWRGRRRLPLFLSAFFTSHV